MMKKLLHKNQTAVFRKQFSITQEEMANYLGISYSLLAMHERGQRTLPAKALIKLGDLLIAYEKSKISRKKSKSLLAMQPEFDKQHEKITKKIQHKAYLHRSGAQKMNHVLRGITARREQAHAWLDIIENRLAGLPQTAAAKSDRLWLSIHHDKVSENILKLNEKQAKLQLEIALSEAVAGVYEGYQLRSNMGRYNPQTKP